MPSPYSRGVLTLIASHLSAYGPPKPAPPVKPGGGRPGGGRPGGGYHPGPHTNTGGGGGHLSGGTLTCVLVMLGLVLVGVLIWKFSRPNETAGGDD